jgi:antitoxin (DNA-binding transcriptional repressor) of toxin-antitoxin stability system
MSVTEIRKRWSEVLTRVDRGEEIAITRRGKLVEMFRPGSLPQRAHEQPTR